MDELTSKAVEALNEGDSENYNTLMDKVTAIESEVREMPKAENISIRDNWKGRITNFPALLEAIVNDYAPASLVKIDTIVLNQLAKSVKDTKRYPGIEFYNDKVVAARTGS